MKILLNLINYCILINLSTTTLTNISQIHSITMGLTRKLSTSFGNSFFLHMCYPICYCNITKSPMKSSPGLTAQKVFGRTPMHLD